VWAERLRRRCRVAWTEVANAGHLAPVVLHVAVRGADWIVRMDESKKKQQHKIKMNTMMQSSKNAYAFRSTASSAKRAIQAAMYSCLSRKRRSTNISPGIVRAPTCRLWMSFWCRTFQNTCAIRPVLKTGDGPYR
jgi:hypothetical protein